jgi:hypothetical protein
MRIKRQRVAGLVAAAMARLDEASHPKGREMLALAVIEQEVAGHAPLVTPCPAFQLIPWGVGLARKLGSTGGGHEGPFLVFGAFVILSRVSVLRYPKTPIKWGIFQLSTEGYVCRIFKQS